jgi:RNA dependent RNA polymerase
MEGVKCRTTMLANQALQLSGVSRNLQCSISSRCDNCQQIDMVDISTVILDALKATTKCQSVDKANFPLGENVKDSLLKFLKLHKPQDRKLNRQLHHWMTCLQQKSASFMLRHSNSDLLLNLPRFEMESSSFAGMLQEDHPYLVRFEAQRLGKQLSTLSLPSCPIQACKDLNKGSNQWNDSSEYLRSDLVVYSAKLSIEGQLQLCPPALEHGNRRIYRMFGRDRLLHLSVSSDVPYDLVHSFLVNPVLVGGRHFRFFWCKMTDHPQVFILFAEHGCGIATEDECTVEMAQSKCIPLKYNPQLTMGQMMKRMQLSFSATTVGCKMPPGSVELVPADGQIIDGAGLISRQAMDAVWSGYKQNAGKKHSSSQCPTGFQGRLAGYVCRMVRALPEFQNCLTFVRLCASRFKGIWILDHTLDGFIVQCRESQRKYLAPMKCLDASQDEVDEAYETMEVCTFCKARVAKLNARAIQVCFHSLCHTSIKVVLT